LGRNPNELLQTVFPGPRERIVEQALRDGRWSGELVHTRKDGTTVTVNSRWSVERGGEGTAARTLETNTDITERKRAEAAFHDNEGRLRLALAAARMGIWTLDLATGAQMRDANLNRLLGLAATETVQPFDEFLTHAHQDDRPRRSPLRTAKGGR
jgi:PAS domain-containing protein